MRRFARFQYKLRNNLIFLNYNKNFHNFSFLETQIDKLNDNIPKHANPFIKGFAQKMLKYQSQLIEVQKHDFNETDLKNISSFFNRPQICKNDNIIQHNQKTQIHRFQPALEDLSLSFSQMQKSIYDNLSKQNLTQSIQTLINYNCIDIKIWQKVISYIIAHYRSSAIKERVLYIRSISEYMKKFEFSSNTDKRTAFKFMYPEGYLIDLIDVRSLFKVLQNQEDFINKDDSQDMERMKLELLENVIYLIMKSTKKTDMNIYSVRKYFNRRINQMILIASRHKKSQLHRKQLYHIYFIYSYLNTSQSAYYQQIEHYYYEDFKQILGMGNSQKQKQTQIQDVSIKSKEMNKLLSIWKLNGRSDQGIYLSCMKPLLKYLIKSNQQMNYISNICLNLVAAGIKDHETIIELVEKCQQNNLKQDQIIHMLMHYLNVIKGEMYFNSKFHLCKSVQNAEILRYLNERTVRLYSSCLQPKGQQIQKKDNSKGYEYRKVEKIWGDAVRKVFGKKYKVIENGVFCNYQIDFLVLTKKYPLAIEVEGGHYNRKQQNRGLRTSNNTQTGKKQMREMILKVYGIKMIKIHCQQKMATFVMQNRDSELGVRLLSRKIQEEIGCKVDDL